METLKTSLITLCCALGLAAATAQTDAPKTNDSPPAASSADTQDTAKPADNGDSLPAAEKKAPEKSPDKSSDTSAKSRDEVVMPAPRADGLLTMNFRGASLESVLKYMVEAAGFVVLPETDVRGKVDVWSANPMTKEQAVALLDSVLRKNGFAAIQEGQTLTIVSLEDAKKRFVPTQSGNDPDKIPRDEKVVTWVIPVRSISAAAAVKELTPLLSATAQLNADEAGNALILTDSHINIRRMCEIVRALDDISGSVNVIKVFPLKYADSKTLASVIKDLFPSQATGNNAAGGLPFGGGRFRGARGGGGFPFPGMGGGGGGEDSNSQARQPKVTAVADDHSNSVIVSAPDELMKIISDVVVSVLDTPINDLTLVRVFKLRNADPTEMADLITSLWPNENNPNDPSRTANQFRFGGFPFPGRGFGGQNAGANADQSERAKKMGQVMAVPDKRTASLIVTAAPELMTNSIEPMIHQLDESSARRQHVHVIQLKYASPEDVLPVMNDLFASTTSRSSRSGQSSQQGSPLTQRATTLSQQALQNSGNTFTTSFGSGGGGRGGP